MQGIKSLFILSILFIVSISANPAKRCGTIVTSTCPKRDSCPNHQPICGAKLILDRNANGCCCRDKISVPPQPQCGANEVFNCLCRDKICNQPDIQCIRCEDGCHCKAGYIRESATGKCIKEGTCPVPQPQCGPHEVYNCLCSDKICNQPDKICKRCLDGCHCKAGYIRESETGKCIKEGTCPPPRPQCGANEVYNCLCRDKICNQPDIQCIRCEDGCHCKAGYIRESATGKCIKEGTCPVPQPQCGPHEVYNCLCSDKICNQPDKICKRCLDGCHCKAGYIRESETGKCIKEGTCPPPRPQCGANEVYNCLCRDKICNQPDIQCIRCEDGCHCKAGYIRESATGKCIKEGSCPAKKCGLHETFGCGCRDKICNEPDVVCIRCQDDCFCDNGYVRDTFGGKCIKAGTCPNTDV